MNRRRSQRAEIDGTASADPWELRQIRATGMEQLKELVQNTREAAARKTLLCAFTFILLGVGPAMPFTPGDSVREPRHAKVERKPKLISNGARQKPFDVTRHTIPLSEIHRSVPKDAIPALVHPKFVTAGEVGNALNDKDPVLCVFLNEEAKAYPIRILNWHELVNDQARGQPILVSW